MTKLRLIPGALFIVILIVSSCKRLTNSKTIKAYWDCYTRENYDSTRLANDLIGLWQLSLESIKGQAKRTKRDVHVLFNSNGTFAVTNEAKIETQGNWYLKIIDGTKFGLITDSHSAFLFGRILLCGDLVVFNNGYIDGDDFYFKKEIK